MATATNSTEGQILLSGDLTGTGESPQLRPTGATPGTYGSSFGAVAPDGTMPVTVPALVVDSKGRVNFIKARTSTETLTPATTSTVGVVKVDGTTITSSGGTITATNISGLPTATTSVMGIARGDDATFYNDAGGRVGIITAGPTRLGKVMPDGTTMQMSGQELKTKNVPCTSTTLGTATGDNTTISVTAGVLSRITPKATASTLGAVRPDNTSVTVDGSGVISAVVPPATASTLGTVRPDNTSVTISSGVLSATLPTATTSTLGVARPDNSTVTISSGVLSVTPNLATTSTLGFVRVGANIDVTAGTISVPAATTSTLGLLRGDNTTITISGGVLSTSPLPIATTSILGGVKVGTNINVSSGTISLSNSTSSVLGVARPDNATITVSGGIISTGSTIPRKYLNNTFSEAQVFSATTYTTSGNPFLSLGEVAGLDKNVMRIHLTGSQGITFRGITQSAFMAGTEIVFVVTKTAGNSNATVLFNNSGAFGDGIFRIHGNSTTAALLTPTSWSFNSILTFKMVIIDGKDGEVCGFIYDEQVIS